MLLLLLMLDFELFIRLGRHFDLIAYPVIDLWLALGSRTDYIVREKSFVNETIEGSWGAEILVVDVAILGRKDSHKVSMLLVLT